MQRLINLDIIDYVRIQRSILVGDAYQIIQSFRPPVDRHRPMKVVGIAVGRRQNVQPRRINGAREQRTQYRLVEKDLVRRLDTGSGLKRLVINQPLK